MPRLYDDESEDDDQTFFDTADHLSPSSYLDTLGSRFDIWIGEPLQSVEERRRNFLNQTGILEMVDVHKEELERMDMERVVESSEAVSSSSSECCEESLGSGSFVCEEREMNGLETNFTVDLGVAASYSEFELCHVAECKRFKKRVKTWWRTFLNKSKRNRDVQLEPAQKLCRRMKVKQNRKKCMDFSAVYVGQEFCAHEGVIRTMKFSPDGQYLASGGEDGVVRIWGVTSDNTPSSSLFDRRDGKGKSCSTIVVPDKDFKIQELPLHEFHGHTSDVLDLAWSDDSNCLLSSSEDKTVRLWEVGRDKCLSVFHHNDYVTCVQFNPVDGNYFISGSIDGKVRMWDVPANRVVNWTDAREVVTAISYQPNGNGFIVGSLTGGNIRFYEASGSDLQLTAEVHIDGRKRSCGNRITGIQFLKEDSQRFMVTSDDSKVRILNGIEVVQKYRGLPNSGSQMSASFTSDGRHIISVGEDSRVYVWNYESTPCIQSSKQRRRSVSSCEHFFSKDVSLAIPWSGMEETEQKDLGSDNQQRYNYIHSYSRSRDEERSSFANCFYGSSATWPEEKLPLCDVQVDDQSNGYDFRVRSETWGLVIVTAGLDGTIRTFHNYGLPVRT